MNLHRFFVAGLPQDMDDPWYDHMVLDIQSCISRGWPEAGDDCPEMVEEINHSIATPIGGIQYNVCKTM